MPGWLKAILVSVVVVGVGGGYVYVFEPQLARQLLATTPFSSLAPAARVTSAYKWRDANGDWQLTELPPPKGTAFEVLETRSGDNIVPAFPTEKK